MSNVVASQVEEHIKYGGVVPEIASRRHIEAVSQVAGAALENAGCALSDIDALAVTYAPGLIGALLVGVNYVKGLSFSSGLPVVPVHHLRSHIASNYICHPQLEPPFLALVVSGGHSHLVLTESYTSFKIIARTRDDAAGEAMDKAARALGLPYPGGLNLDRVSANGNPRAYAFPRPRVDGSEFDFSFSGLKTAALNTINSLAQKGETPDTADFGASYIDAVTECLADTTDRAAALLGSKKIVVCGGVSANSVLRRKMEEQCKSKGRELYMPELKFCGDNAAMVGSQGYYEYLSGNIADLSLNAYATMSIEQG